MRKQRFPPLLHQIRLLRAAVDEMDQVLRNILNYFKLNDTWYYKNVHYPKGQDRSQICGPCSRLGVVQHTI
jgi:hypothetical protein